MKINIFFTQIGLFTVLLFITLLPYVALAHGGATVAEETSENNMKIIVSIIVLLALGIFIWFNFFRKK